MLNERAPLPDAVIQILPGRLAVKSHTEVFNPQRWRRELHRRSLPVPTIFEAPGDRSRVSRSDLMIMADAEPTPARALDLLLCSLAWGLGLRASRLTARLDALGKHKDLAASRLMSAWTAVRRHEEVATAYRILADENGVARIPWLGAAFLTKFLYFAEGSDHRPRHLILDAVVARNLRPYAWPDSPTTQWHPLTYSRYCALFDAWAGESSAILERPVWPDEIELAVFRYLRK